MDFRPTEEQVLLRRTIREFADTEIRPHVREWDEQQHFPRELMPKLAALGLLGIQYPEQYGGAAMSAIDYCICIEELARVDPAVSLSVAAHNGLCSAHIFLFGTEEQKQKYLAPLARGERIGGWGLTESTSGSDAAGMRTTATQAGGCWILNGTKTFTTHGRTGGRSLHGRGAPPGGAGRSRPQQPPRRPRRVRGGDRTRPGRACEL